jgi:hypothetical protein
VLTESPFKVQLEAQVAEKNKNKKTELQRKRITFGKGKVESSKREREEYSCPGCTEQVTEPPNEDWIQCGTCEEWCMNNARLIKGKILYVTCVMSCLLKRLCCLFIRKINYK